MNLDDAIDDYNSEFNASLGVFLFAGNEDKFIKLVKESLKNKKPIEKPILKQYFPPLKKGVVY